MLSVQNRPLSQLKWQTCSMSHEEKCEFWQQDFWVICKAEPHGNPPGKLRQPSVITRSLPFRGQFHHPAMYSSPAFTKRKNKVMFVCGRNLCQREWKGTFLHPDRANTKLRSSVYHVFWLSNLKEDGVGIWRAAWKAIHTQHMWLTVLNCHVRTSGAGDTSSEP